MILILKNLEKNELLSLVFVTTTKIIMFTHFRHILHTLDTLFSDVSETFVGFGPFNQSIITF